jgi:His-Xaa-Ser system radical SAM maturase HxsB
LSRLTSLAKPASVDLKGLGAFNFRDMGGWHLLTNDWGRYMMLDEDEFGRFMSGRLDEKDPLWGELAGNGFVRERIDFASMARSYAEKTAFQRFPGPSLHMIVVTLRCNQQCHYCHSSVVDPSRTDTDMDLATAKKTVDFIFDTPNPAICIEFQGGEPLLNWPIVKFVTLYARKKAEASGRKLFLTLVSNFTLMTEERVDFLFENGVSICTSLDGPPELHNKNRPFLGSGAAQEKVVHWLGRMQARCDAIVGRPFSRPSALMTTTRFSFDYSKEIVDLYVKMGMEQIFIRGLSPIGYAKRVWGDIGYTSKEFLDFYSRTLDYIIDLNKKGTPIMERMALILLTKIVRGVDPGFMDLRSPTGAVLGCLAYNYNGEIFVSDEGRMLDHEGDDSFKVGDVATSDWDAVLGHPVTRACVVSSVLENQPMCAQCTYKPYCGVEPVYHYETQKSIFGSMPTSGWCMSRMGLFDVIFQKLRDKEARKIFDRWLDWDQRWTEKEPAAAADAAVGAPR